MAGEESRAKGAMELVLTRGELYNIPGAAVFLTKQYQIPRGGWINFNNHVCTIPIGRPFVVHVYREGRLLYREIWVRANSPNKFHAYYYPLDALKEAMVTICKMRSIDILGDIGLIDLAHDAKRLNQNQPIGLSHYGTW